MGQAPIPPAVSLFELQSKTESGTEYAKLLSMVPNIVFSSDDRFVSLFEVPQTTGEATSDDHPGNIMASLPHA